MKKKFDIKGMVAGQLVDRLNAELAKAESDPNYTPSIPWVKPWKGGYEGMPKNLASKNPYRGINV